MSVNDCLTAGEIQAPDGHIFNGAPIPAEAAFGGDPFRLLEPQELTSGVVFSSPHSGAAYFADFQRGSRLDPRRLRASEDAYVDELFVQAAGFGAPVLSAVAPRAYVDLNRDPADLDPALVEGADASVVNARVVAGLGVVPRIVAEGVPIYDRRLTLAEAQARIERWHAPYHARLAELLLRARRRFGRALLIDCHSMPSDPRAARRGGSAVDIVIGDRFGVSSDPEMVDAVEAALAARGLRVARNAPFAGGYITERYGRPASGVSAVQIEIDRALYLDQRNVTRSEGFWALRRDLAPVISTICGLIGGAPRGCALAAE